MYLGTFLSVRKLNYFFTAYLSSQVVGINLNQHLAGWRKKAKSTVVGKT